MKNPKEIITKIREFRNVEVNVTASSVRAQLYRLKMNKKEEVNEFCGKLDNIIREYETCDTSVPLSEEEKRSAFYQAVSYDNPELRSADLIRRQTDNKEMNLEEIKSFLLPLEAEKRSSEETREPRANFIPEWQSGPHAKCFRCNKHGHMAPNCPLIKQNLWFCYYCNAEADHKGTNCPNKGTVQAPRRFDNNYNKDYTTQDYSNNYTQFRSNKNIRGRGSNRGRGNLPRGGGRGNFRGRVFKRGGNRGARGAAKNTLKQGATAYIAGTVTNQLEPQTQITLIADSGATDHIVNKGIILSDFKQCTGEFIRSANKNDSANIQIDGKGNLVVKSNINTDEIIILNNVISAENISENLISLRRFADVGLGIYLDDEILKIFDKNTGAEYITGKYEKPNWIINLEVEKQSNINNVNSDCEKYSCMARLVTLDEFLQQSQTDVLNLETEELPDENTEKIETNTSEIGRENREKLVQTKQNIRSPQIANDFDLDESILKRKIDNLDNTSINESMEIINCNEKPDDNKKNKLNEGMLWHIRLGHASLGYLKQMQKSDEKLKGIKFDKDIMDCEVCIMAKMEKLPFSENRTRGSRPLEMIHTDTMGPIKPASFPGGNRFIIVFVDDYTRFAKAYSVKHKNEAGDCLEKFLITTRNLLGKDEKVCYIRADNGTEFIGGKFSEVMKQENIEYNVAPPHTPELNGTAERFNKTLQNKIRALMIDSGLPESMWILGVEAAVHIYNRTPHKSLNSETPINMLTPKVKNHLEKIRRFGCVAYAKIPITEKKFSERAIKAIMVGYSATGYILWHPSTGKFLHSRHVRCNEKDRKSVV